MAEAVTLDAGALIAIERRERRMGLLLDSVDRHGGRVVVPATALAQVWRDGASQALLARLLKTSNVTVAELDESTAKAVGVICGFAKTSDVIDAHVVIVARRHQAVIITSDSEDIRRLDPAARIAGV